MNTKNRSTCMRAVDLLRSTPQEHPYWKKRSDFADHLETQVFQGNPLYDHGATKISELILSFYDEDGNEVSR